MPLDTERIGRATTLPEVSGTQNIFTHPLNFNHDGGEAIFNLPNGLQGYYLANSSGFRLDDAPINIVSNPAASDPTVRNGISCIGCHTEGMKTFEDQVRSAIESTTNPSYNKAQALRLYVEQSVMDARVGVDMERYREALVETGGTVGGVEPISRFHETFQGPVDAAYAAALVGLETEAFLEKVRANTGLQNVGLLALEGENGSVKRDTWTSSFRDVIYALDYPQQVGEPTVITQPDVLPGGQVHFPDSNLRAAIVEALGKSTNAPISVEEMKGLRRLDADHRGIHDLTGIQSATNLRFLSIKYNQISDLSPLRDLIELNNLRADENPLSDISAVRGLTNLTQLEFDYSQVSDISAVRNLTNLIHLQFDNTPVSDMSPISGLTKLRYLEMYNTLVTDLSPLAGLTNLQDLHMSNIKASDLSPLAGLIKLVHISFSDIGVTDISPLAGLLNLKIIRTWGNRFSDLSPLSRLKKLEKVDICGAELTQSDLSPLAGLTGLKELYLAGNGISDISPIARLTGLERLNLHNNHISNISPLAVLTNLKWLAVDYNSISDFSPLDGLRANTKIEWHNNPGFPKGGPKIEGPWLWVYFPKGKHLNMDFLAEATDGGVTEEEVATHGATEGNSVGDEVWTSDKLPPTGRNNIWDMVGQRLPHGVIYGSVSFYSPREQNTTMYVGAEHGLKVWLNGVLLREHHQRREGEDYNDFFPVTLHQGRNVLLVAVATDVNRGANAFFGFETGTEYAVGTGIGYAFSETPIHIGDTFTFDVRAESISDLAGWQFDIAFNPSILEAIDVREGDFLKAGGESTFFQGGRIDNASGKITGLSAALLAAHGVSGSGSVLQVRFKAKSEGETPIALQNFLFGSITEESINAAPLEIRITVQERLLTGDVNRDGIVNILDLIRVARQLGQRVAADSPVDLNGDGVINIFDLTLVAQGIGGAAAPAIKRVDNERDRDLIETWITLARLEDDGSIAFRQGIANLENLLASLIIPKETALHANYPNPFNPETWIPYQLAAPAEVALTIYDMSGGTVRRLEVGLQAAGLYQSRSRAVYWDGRNDRGESVASGLYFYTLRAGEFTATRKMLIRK